MHRALELETSSIQKRAWTVKLAAAAGSNFALAKTKMMTDMGKLSAFPTSSY